MLYDLHAKVHVTEAIGWTWAEVKVERYESGEITACGTWPSGFCFLSRSLHASDWSGWSCSSAPSPSEAPALHSGGKCFNCISMSVSSENVLVPQRQAREQQSAGCREERPPRTEPWNTKNTANYKYIYSGNTHLTGKAARRPAAPPPSPPQPHDCFLLAAWELHRRPFALYDLKAIFLSPMRQKKKGCRPNCSSYFHHIFHLEMSGKVLR